MDPVRRGRCARRLCERVTPEVGRTRRRHLGRVVVGRERRRRWPGRRSKVATVDLPPPGLDFTHLGDLGPRRATGRSARMTRRPRASTATPPHATTRGSAATDRLVSGDSSRVVRRALGHLSAATGRPGRQPVVWVVEFGRVQSRPPPMTAPCAWPDATSGATDGDRDAPRDAGRATLVDACRRGLLAGDGLDRVWDPDDPDVPCAAFVNCGTTGPMTDDRIVWPGWSSDRPGPRQLDPPVPRWAQPLQRLSCACSTVAAADADDRGWFHDAPRRARHLAASAREPELAPNGSRRSPPYCGSVPRRCWRHRFDPTGACDCPPGRLLRRWVPRGQCHTEPAGLDWW